MIKNDKNIKRWLQQEISNEEYMPEEDWSAEKSDLAEDIV